MQSSTNVNAGTLPEPFCIRETHGACCQSSIET
jgi:hypothetical protein